jgi:hypothetical protein
MHMQKKESGAFYNTTSKKNSKWIKDINLRLEITKQFKEMRKLIDTVLCNFLLLFNTPN